MRIHFTKRWLLPLALLIGLLAYFLLDLNNYLTFSTLKQHREFLLKWTNTNYIYAVLIYIAVYSIAVTLSIPGAALLTITGGFLFGLIFGTIYAIISATLGATCLFMAIKFAFEPWLVQSTSQWIGKMRKGFQNNAIQYLLTLRLIPIFPFWAVNIVPAILGVNLRTFVIGTFIGIIPGTTIYVAIGTGLGHLFDQDKTPNLGIIFEPVILLPLIGLGLLSLSPILYKWFRRKST